MADDQDQNEFEAMTQRVAQFRAEHGRHPVPGVERDQQEKSVGQWLAGQRVALRRGTLGPERQAFLDRALPDWREGDASEQGPQGGDS